MTAEGSVIRFGLIGVDSAHAVQFTRVLGDGGNEGVEGGRIAAAWQGPTVTDFPPSRDRNDQLAAEVAGLGVPVLDAPEAVAEVCDALLIVASDSRSHPDHFRRLARFGKPIYVDTRFAPSRREAQDMIERAAQHGCLVLGGSPKRFTPEFRAARADVSDPTSIHLEGAMPEQPHHPVLAWYGVHLVDLAVATLGPRCRTVDARGERVVLTWDDGRTATLGGPREWQAVTSGAIRGEDRCREFRIEANAQMLRGLLSGLIASCRSGIPNIPAAEILAIVDIVNAAERSRLLAAPVDLPDQPEA